MKLYEKLKKYGQYDYYPFHMPGHKRNLTMLPKWNPYEMDITEIDGFDNLHDAQEILADTMKEIANFRGAEDSFLLINGTTCGLLAGISACVERGSEVIVARNCHKAVYHGIFLNELKPHYIYPPIHRDHGINGGISPEKIKNMLISYPNTKLVILTSPTYEGVVSDIKQIAKVVHSYGIPLLVDQAHGAHFGIEETFPKSAVELGADIVVESVHKTLPAFTQTALLHLQGDIVKKEKIKQYLGIFETSSPSYLMMAGIEWCEEFCKKEKLGAFVSYVSRLKKLRRKISELTYIFLMDESEMCGAMDGVAYDIGKLVIGVKNNVISGQELADILLEKYHLQIEMASLHYVIAMTSVMDTQEGFDRLLQALMEIEKDIEKQVLGMEKKVEENVSNTEFSKQFYENEMVYTPYEADGKEKKTIVLEEAINGIVGDYVYLYPPGIPLLVPGERISESMVEFIKKCRREGLSVKGVCDGNIKVIDCNFYSVITESVGTE